MKNPLVAQRVELEAKIVALEKTKSNRVELIKSWILQANSLRKPVSEGNYPEMSAFLKKVGLNKVFRDQTLHVSFLKPWNLLAEMNSATTTHAPLCGENEKWWR